MQDPDHEQGDLEKPEGTEWRRVGASLADHIDRAVAYGQAVPTELKERLSLLAARAAGLDTAADFYARYLDGSGGINRLTRDQVIALEPFASAETENKERFENWTFVGGKTADSDDGNTNTNIDAHLLRELEDGQRLSFSDHWDQNFNISTFIEERLADGRNVEIWDLAGELLTKDEGLSFSKLLKELLGINLDFTLSFGASTLKSEGEFDAVRTGDVIRIEGVVTHSVDDDYNFNPGRENSDDAEVLEKAGFAKTFTTEAAWQQPVTATVSVEERPGMKSVLRVIDVEWGEPVDVRAPAPDEAQP